MVTSICTQRTKLILLLTVIWVAIGITLMLLLVHKDTPEVDQEVMELAQGDHPHEWATIAVLRRESEGEDTVYWVT